MKVADIEKQIEELQKKKERMLKQREYQKNFQNKKRGEKMEKELMNKKEILDNIADNGGFDNFNRWNKKEIAEWVESNFPCTKYTANQVAEELA